MKMKSLSILSAITVTSFVFGTPLYAQGTDSRIGSIKRERGEHAAVEAKAISKADAEKKYPAHGGAYPVGQRDAHDAVGVSSVHTHPTNGMTARKLHTAHWFWTHKLTKSL